MDRNHRTPDTPTKSGSSIQLECHWGNGLPESLRWSDSILDPKSLYYHSSCYVRVTRPLTQTLPTCLETTKVWPAGWNTTGSHTPSCLAMTCLMGFLHAFLISLSSCFAVSSQYQGGNHVKLLNLWRSQTESDSSHVSSPFPSHKVHTGQGEKRASTLMEKYGIFFSNDKRKMRILHSDVRMWDSFSLTMDEPIDLPI